MKSESVIELGSTSAWRIVIRCNCKGLLVIHPISHWEKKCDTPKLYCLHRWRGSAREFNQDDIDYETNLSMDVVCKITGIDDI